MQTKPKFLRASLITGIAVVFPVVLLSLALGLSGGDIISSGEVDNDPMRAGWMILFLSPVFYAIIVAVFYGVTRVLASFGKLRFDVLFILVVVAGIVLASTIAADSLIAFLTTLCASLLLLTVGLVTWFKCS